jgi:starch phosphorylase
MRLYPVFHGRPTAYAEVMRPAIAINGSFLNTQRMLSQYLSYAYFQETAS